MSGAREGPDAGGVMAAAACGAALRPALRARVFRSRLGRAGLGCATGLALLVVATLATEVVLRVFVGRAPPEGRVFRTRLPDGSAGEPVPLHAPDPLLGWRPPRDAAMRAIRTVEGRAIYDVEYTFDAHGRRVTPSPASGTAREAIIFVGCSVTFGEGVNDAETLPARVAALRPDAAVVNGGVCGYGPHQVLLRLADPELTAGLSAVTTTTVYVLIDDHARRAVWSCAVATWADPGAPCFALDDRGRPAYQGSFRKAQRLRTALVGLLARSRLRRVAGLDWPPAWWAAPRELTAALIIEAARCHRARFGNDRFLVVVQPRCRIGQRIGPALSTAGVELLDLADESWFTEPGMHLPRDPHPSPAAYERLARRLIRHPWLAPR